MNIKVQDKMKGGIIPQYIDRDWYNDLVSPCLEFSFVLDGEDLVFSASRQEGACVHPDGELNKFQAELWMYDVAEFFMARPDLSFYMEFNLSPNGAWWSQVFKGVRLADESIAALEGVRCSASVTAQSWACSARIPLIELERLGLDVRDCRLAFCSIQNTPEQIFITTADDLAGEPDFHQPKNWPLCECL